MEEIFILGACRTDIGTFGESLANVSVIDIAKTVIRESLIRLKISHDSIDEVIMGHVLQAGLGQNTARQAAVAAGIPIEVPSMTINKVCSSGLKAVILAAQIIKAGDAQHFVPVAAWGRQ